MKAAYDCLFVVTPPTEDSIDNSPPEIQLKLVDLLPTRCVDLEVQSLAVMRKDSHDGIMGMLRPWRAPSLTTDLKDVPLHPNAEAALSICDTVEDNFLPAVVDVYTDGSEKQGRASYAIAPMAHGTANGQWLTAFMGTFGGRVCTDPNDACFIRAQNQTSVAWAAADLWELHGSEFAPRVRQLLQLAETG